MYNQLITHKERQPEGAGTQRLCPQLKATGTALESAGVRTPRGATPGPADAHMPTQCASQSSREDGRVVLAGASAYCLSASKASRILNEHTVWKRPVPLSEPGESLLARICSESSP